MSLKSEILSILESRRGSPVSGQELADRLSVSRAAVWKAVRGLEADGHRITAATHCGYCLEPASDLLTAEGIRFHLPASRRDCRIEVHPTLRSTNTLAKSLAAEGAPHGTLLVAEEQTAGRGRHGRSFFSPAKTGLYMSVLLRPDGPVEELPVLTVAAAVAVCRTIERLTPCRPAIKWVNDIFLDGRKVAGILTEAVSDFESGMADCVIVGIGLNVRTPENRFPPDLRGIAGSLAAGEVSRNQLAAGIAAELLDCADDLTGRAFLDDYRARSLVLGRRIRFYRQGEALSGSACGIGRDGSLLVNCDGRTLSLRAGEICLQEESPL